MTLVIMKACLRVSVPVKGKFIETRLLLLVFPHLHLVSVPVKGKFIETTKLQAVLSLVFWGVSVPVKGKFIETLRRTPHLVGMKNSFPSP